MLPRYKINKKEQCIALGCGGFDDVPSAGGEADENFCVGPHVLCGLCSTYFGQAYHASSNHKTVCVYHIPAKATSGANYMPRIEHLRGNACLATNDLLEMLRASAQFNAGEEGAKVAWENLVLQRCGTAQNPHVSNLFYTFCEHYDSNKKAFNETYKIDAAMPPATLWENLVEFAQHDELPNEARNFFKNDFKLECKAAMQEAGRTFGLYDPRPLPLQGSLKNSESLRRLFFTVNVIMVKIEGLSIDPYTSVWRSVDVRPFVRQLTSGISESMLLLATVTHRGVAQGIKRGRVIHAYCNWCLKRGHGQKECKRKSQGTAQCTQTEREAHRAEQAGLGFEVTYEGAER